MDSTNCQTKIPKPLSNLPVYCPWTSRAPLSSPITLRFNEKPIQENNSQNLSQVSTDCHRNTQCGSNDQINYDRATATIPCPSIQQSSNLFFHFLRLMQLFPDVHPATLHTAMVLCKNNFFCAVDKLLYAKKCKSIYNQRNLCAQKLSTPKPNRFQPYSSSKPTTMSNQSHVNEVYGIPTPIIGIINLNECPQVTPLDVSLKTRESYSANDVTDSATENNYKSDTNETKQIKIILQPTLNQELPVMSSSVLYTLPISPLSPTVHQAMDYNTESTKNFSCSDNNVYQ